MANVQNNPFGGAGSWGGASNAYKYPNPFCDIASVYIPTNLNDAFEWMEYLMLTMPPFMSVVNRVVSYFLTDIEISDVSDDVRDKYEKVFDDELHIIQKLQDIGKDYFCFGGDTKVFTSNGFVPIRELSGKTEDVLCIDGRWRPADFHSHGIQRTHEVRFGNGCPIRATDDHLWWVDAGDDGDMMSGRTTDSLKYWHRIPIKPLPRPESDENYGRGLLHGLVLSSQSSKRPKYDNELIKWCEGQYGLERDGSMSSAPSVEEPTSYWYGVFCGMAALRGYFQKSKGLFFVTHSDGDVLSKCAEGFSKFGLIARPVSRRKVWGGASRYYLPVHVRNLERDDFIREDMQAVFDELAEGREKKFFTGVRSGMDPSTGRDEEVFCCVEPETHTFTIDGGIVTRNCYGNSFVSLYLPFERYLQCPDCGTQIHISRIKYDFDAEHGRFMCECPGCKKGKVEFKRVDRRLRDTGKINIIRWNPKRIKIKVHPISGEIKYYYKLEEKFVEKVREGDPFYINTSQWGFIDTCTGEHSKHNSAECLFEFSDGQIYHMRDTVFAGLQDKIRGWAIPPLLPYFKLAYYIQLMRRYDEAIALDFIMPFRILYPQGQAPGGQDALTMVSMQTFIAAMSGMVEKKRANMTSIEVSPFAIGYELIGGEAKQLAPKESIQQAEQELLNAMGFPQELFAGTLSLQAAPVALRLFEREWNPFVDGMNTILQWISDQIARYFMWDKAEVRLTPITLADDMEKKGLQMQAAAGQDISKQTAYRAMGIDYLQEQQRIIKEQQDIQKMQEKAMAEAQAQQANGAMGGGEGGGAEGGGDASGMNGPGGQVGATPSDLMEQAQQLADTLVKDPDPSHVRSTLINLKNTNPALHAQVRQFMQDERNQLSSAGRQMMIQQARQGG